MRGVSALDLQPISVYPLVSLLTAPVNTHLNLETPYDLLGSICICKKVGNLICICREVGKLLGSSCWTHSVVSPKHARELALQVKYHF